MTVSLTGILASRTTDNPPAFLGKRFDAEGQPLPCSGSTIIAHLREPASTAFAAAVDHISAGPARDCWAWLPASSHHMTMFDLVQHERREPERWPKGLAVDASAQEADRFMLSRLRDFDPQTDPVFSMCVQALEAHASGLWARVEPVSDSDNARLRGLRDRLARHVGLDHRPGHADYAFHVTLAYAIDWPTQETATATDILIAQADETLKSALPVFDVGPPEVCLFDDMCEFRTQFTL